MKEICSYIQRGKSPKYVDLSKYPVISQKCVRWESLDLKPIKYISEESLANYESIRFLQSNDILWNSTGTGTVGRASIYFENEDYKKIVVDSHVTVVRPLGISSKYLYSYISSPQVQTNFEDLCDGSTNQKELSLSTVTDFLIPRPPLTEQDRISTKIEQLLSLVDKIESDKVDLKELVKQTKAKVLDLAIRGKLVNQCPNDEPTEKLLEKIKEEKEKLIQEGKLKRDKNETYIYKNSDDNSYYEKIGTVTVCIDDELPFEIPDSWRWVKAQSYIDVRDGTHDTPKYVKDGIPLITSKNISSGNLDFTNIQFISRKDHSLISLRSKVDKGDILFAMIGSIGNPVIVDKDIEFSIKNVALFKPLESNKQVIKFVYYYLVMIQTHLRNNSRGGNQPFVSLAILRNIFIPIPPKEEQLRIIHKIETIFKELDNIEEMLKVS